MKIDEQRRMNTAEEYEDRHLTYPSLDVCLEAMVNRQVNAHQMCSDIEREYAPHYLWTREEPPKKYRTYPHPIRWDDEGNPYYWEYEREEELR
ncbi:MAG: hypothetical protein HY363_03185 [Candidatus Aenigmarchaeota archaeon]|nr:hypothetical protein [Candidatus Aenigmarchaeota archaeon]